MQVTIVKTVRLSYFHLSLVFNFWKLEIWNVDFKGTRMEFEQYSYCLRSSCLCQLFIWAYLCILSLICLSVVCRDSQMASRCFWFSWSHHAFLKHAPSPHPGSLASLSWQQFEEIPGLNTFSSWSKDYRARQLSRARSPRQRSRAESSRCEWVSFFFLPSLCTDVSLLPQSRAFWLFAELLTHYELSHYLNLPDLLWTDFSQERSSWVTQSARRHWERLQLICPCE